MLERGSIRHIDRYKQLLDFSGLQFERKITPTDIDMLIDFGSKELVIGEFKSAGAPVHRGQLRCITSLLEVHHSYGIRSLGMIAYHDYPPEQVIMVSKLLVDQLWFHPRKGWVPESKGRTVREIIDAWREWGH